jgi:hypothetical protein
LNHTTASLFQRYIGIDYSGAQTPEASLKGLRAYQATAAKPAEEVLPPPGPRKFCTRRGLSEWMREILCEPIPTLVGIDHGFSFPLRYFEVHHLMPDWQVFLEDFQRHWPTDAKHMYVDFVRDGLRGKGAERSGSARWRRLTEERCGAKSVFHFDVPGSVAKSTHAGLPWLLYLRQQLGSQPHWWPFDGWAVPPGRSVIAEMYPLLWKRDFVNDARTPDQQDAYIIAQWLRQTDLAGQLPGYFNPTLLAQERTVAGVEGWILGVPG